jgi:hypothetical protein
MSVTIPRPLPAGSVDRYWIRLDLSWMAGSTISAANVASENTGVLTIGDTDISGNEIGFMVTGAAAGRSKVHIELTLSDGRSDCKSVVVIISTC